MKNLLYKVNTTYAMLKNLVRHKERIMPYHKDNIIVLDSESEEVGDWPRQRTLERALVESVLQDTVLGEDAKRNLS